MTKIKVFYSKSYNGWSEDDARAVFNLISDHYDAPAHLKPKTVDDLEMPYFVVYSGEECTPESIIGVSFFRPINDYLVRTYRTVIHKDHRGKGIGTRLNLFMELEFHRKKFKKIVCNIYTDNQASVALKLKMNYIIEGTLRDHDGPGMDEYILSKIL